MSKTFYLVACACAIAWCAGGQPGSKSGMLPPVRLETIPAGPLLQQLKSMPADMQSKVLGRLEALEIPEEDLESLRAHPRGVLSYVCAMGSPETGEPLSPVALIESVAITGAVSIAEPPAWHSRPGSTNVLFLDFNGAVVSNTAWNSYPTYGLVSAWDCRPYSIDTNETTFSVVEQISMRTIWERVSEDYAPFDIDVTTEHPKAWTRYTGHVLITPDMDKNGVPCPHEGAGGVAFVDVFGREEYSYNYAGECYSPAWVLNYESVLAPEYEAEAAAHEMGHNLALSHDGTKKEAYYGGHDGGSIGWGPIMGTGYNRDVSQWSKGDYRLSNNSQDDLAIISARIGYRPDDFPDDRFSAGLLSLDAAGVVYQTGVVEQTFDTDVFAIHAVSGLVDITVFPYRDTSSATWGGDLDAVLELYDEGGGLVATNNPALDTTAGISITVSKGVYYLHVHSTGVGDPFGAPSPNGYVRYGSLGQYTLTGSIAIDPDIDGDGMPNAWEMAYFNGLTNAIAFLDEDGDGENNLAEFISGHHPGDPSSVFTITNYAAPSTSTGAFVVSWESVTGRIYGVSWLDNLTNTPVGISGNLPYPAASYTDAVQRIGPRHFYRVEVRLEP